MPALLPRICRNGRLSQKCTAVRDGGKRQSAERSAPVWIPEARQVLPAPDGKYTFRAAGLKALPEEPAPALRMEQGIIRSIF